MKNSKALLAISLLAASFVATSTSWAANGVIAKDVLTPGSYCHMKFPAINLGTIASENPQLKDASSGDVVDFYGPCDESPTGQDQATYQRLEEDWHNPASNE